jgi:spore maturation protein CgeB
MQQSRIALNIMPWFKKGAHDRIFNAMLQRCAVVTDSSGYLDQILVPQHNAVVFSLEQREELPQQIEALLQQPSALREMAEAGYRTAKESHTWAHRALKILGSE